MKTSNIILASAFIIGLIFFGIDLTKISSSIKQQKANMANTPTVALDFFDKVVVSDEINLHFAQAEKTEIKYISKRPVKNGFEIKNNVLYITGNEGEILNLSAPNIRHVEIKNAAQLTIEEGNWDSLRISASNSSIIILGNTQLNYLHISAQNSAIITCKENQHFYKKKKYNTRKKHYDNLTLINHIDLDLNGYATSDLASYEVYHLTGKISKNAHLELGRVQNPEIEIPGNRISIW